MLSSAKIVMLHGEVHHRTGILFAEMDDISLHFVYEDDRPIEYFDREQIKEVTIY